MFEKRTGGGIVYIIEADMPNRMGHGWKTAKIGWTKDDEPDRRLRDLQVGCPVLLSVALTLPGAIAAERGLHQVFARFRVRGEWFLIPWTPVEWVMARMPDGGLTATGLASALAGTRAMDSRAADLESAAAERDVLDAANERVEALRAEEEALTARAYELRRLIEDRTRVARMEASEQARVLLGPLRAAMDRVYDHATDVRDRPLHAAEQAATGRGKGQRAESDISDKTGGIVDLAA